MLREHFKTVLKQWTFYATIALLIVLYFMKRGDMAANICAGYLGGMQIFLIAYWFTRNRIRQKREISHIMPVSQQKELKNGIQSDCLTGFFHNLMGVVEAGALLGIIALVLHLS